MPAFDAHKLDWDAQQQNFALRAVGSPAAFKSLVDQLKNEQTSQEVRRNLIDDVARNGGEQEVEALFALALEEPNHQPQIKADLLAGLVQMSRVRMLKPPPHSEKLNALLESDSDAVRAAAMKLAGAWKRAALRNEMLDALQSAKSSDAVRAAAATGLAYLGDRDTAGQLRTLSASAADMQVRQAALIGLTQLDLKAAVASATELLSKGDADPAPLLTAFLSRDGGGDALASNLQGKPIPADTAKLALRYLRGSSMQNPKLTEIFSAASGMSGAPIRLSADQMKQTIEDVLAKGDPANGERVFRRAETSCYQCHSIDSSGGWLAPDLSSISASSQLDYLINSVLDPNKDIKDGYDGLLIVTKSGDAISGIKVSQDNSRLILRDNTHQQIPILLSDIKAQKSIGSLMPNGLSDTLTHQEFLDLIRFLSVLGKPGPYASSPRQFVRTWQIVDPLPAEMASARPAPSSIAALEGKEWTPAYSLVSGGMLPMDVFPSKTSTAYVRAHINVTAAGEIRLLFNDSRGIELWVDDKPTTAASETPLDLPSGLHSLTLKVDVSQRSNEGISIEIADAPGSNAHAQLIGGR